MINKSGFLTIVLMLTLFVLSACGLNPVEKLEEEAAEQIAEKIIEQGGGVEDVQLEVDGDSISYSADDGEGNEVSVAVNANEDIDAIIAFGFNIPLPNGLTNGTIQRMDENGEEFMVNAAFELDGISYEQFVQEIHRTLVAQGFTYMDMMGSDVTEPDPVSMPMIIYAHEDDGIQFTIMGDDEAAILGLSKDPGTSSE